MHFCRQLVPILGLAVILKGRRVHTNGNHKEQRGLETPVCDYGLQGVHFHNVNSAVAPADACPYPSHFATQLLLKVHEQLSLPSA